ncbi:MAG: hypothetical protein IJD74_01610 [Clostridia bacterium]|nr:hypothetical protein [Clostridia bacterium]
MDTFEILFLALVLIAITITTIVAVVNKVKERAAENAKWEKEWAEAQAAEAKRRAEAEANRRKQAQINDLLQKYMSSPYTIEAAENFTRTFIKAVESLNRDIRNEIVSMEDVGILANVNNGTSHEISTFGYQLRTRENYRDTNTELINFTKKNLQPLKNELEIHAFLKAVSLNACDMIKKQYPRDKSGTVYSLTASEPFWDRGYYIKVEFKYSARNASYTAPAEW